ncbi:MAG: 1-acyl-sn-glycerol-3-phosphate acyltransferase [Candidatus Cloacimonetes bacterium]|nr:1-acyl-sn-glycerol-3-phosphate acyltransferase [Candidatus Cloacimonadota bacterium]
MKLSETIANKIIKLILKIICKVDSTELKKIPDKGPYIIAINHTNFLEVPIFYTFLQPRKVIGIAKRETWDNKFSRWLANSWDAIPLDREGATVEAFRKAYKALLNSYFLVIAPEGTRNKTGRLREAKSGIISIAIKANVPVIPVAHYGGEKLAANLKRIKRTQFTIKVGQPIILNTLERVDQAKRKYFVDQLMYRIAELLPKKYRGAYAEIGSISKKDINDWRIDE